MINVTVKCPPQNTRFGLGVSNKLKNVYNMGAKKKMPIFKEGVN